MKKITIGARGSKLSLAYVAKVRATILKKNPNLSEDDIFIKTIKTSGDIFHDKKLSEIGGKNLFCKEIEENLLDKKIDIAVHSLKDMESEENKNLIVGAYIERNDPRDIFISSKFKSLDELEQGSTIGSSSRRRELQLKLINKDISILNIRGNIDTRIKKLENGELDAIILAAAGVKSLNFEKKIKSFFSTEVMIPAAGQGIIAVQCRKNDEYIKKILYKINHRETNLCAVAEREMLRTINGDCDTAVGSFAVLKNENIILKAQLFSDDGKKSFNFEASGNKEDAIKIGQEVGIKLLKLAGKEFEKKMNILITRPLIDSEDLMGKFFSMGHKIIYVPTLKISSANMDPINLNDYDAFIFTSANAIRNLKIVSKDKKNIFCFCVGAITEKIARQSGYINTISAGGNVNALKNLIVNSEQINKKSNIAYFCGDNISSDLDLELKSEGIKVKKIVNYLSEKIIDLNKENKKIIENHPPDTIFVYSRRSAQSFIEIVKNYSLYPIMTGSTVMCISKKVADIFAINKWKKIKIFNPGEEFLKLEELSNECVE